MRQTVGEILVGYTFVIAWLALFVLLWSCPATAESRPDDVHELPGP